MAFQLVYRARLALALILMSAVFAATPASAQTPEPLTFPNIELGVGGSVYAIVPVSGGYVVAGQFNSVNGELRDNLARVDLDGVVDPDWNPGTDGAVLAVDWDGADGVFIGGDFSDVGGLARDYVARVSLATGNVDPGWNPGANGIVRSLVHDGASHLYLAGAFGSVGGQNRARIAKVHADTGVVDAWSIGGGGPPAYALEVDANWVYLGRQNTLRRYARSNAAVDAAWNPNPQNRVLALLHDGAGNLYVGGRFNAMNGQSRQGIARLSAPAASGAAVLSATFNPGTDGLVDKFALSGATLYVGGDFSTIGGQNLPRLARLSTANGSADASWRPNPNREIFALAIAPGGQPIAGGPFGSIGGIGRVGLARLDLVSGAVDPSFVAQATATGSVRALVSLPDGSIIAGGVFDSARDLANDGALLPRANLIRIDAGGALDSGWFPSVDGQVGALAIDGDELVVGGTFLFSGATQRNRLARFDIDSAALLGWNPGANGEIRALAVDAGLTYVGGAFTSAGGALRSFLAAIDGSGLATSLDATIAGFQVDSLLLDGTSLYLGGDFSSVQGQTRNGLARMDLLAEVLDPGFDPDVLSGGDSGRVASLTHAKSGAIYLGGTFSSVGGVARANVAKVHADGSVSSWNPGTNNSVDAIGVDAHGVAYLGGSFSAVGGLPRLGLARIGPAGDIDPGWQPTANILVRQIIADLDSVMIGGEFSAVSNQFRSGVAALPAQPGAEVSVIEITSLAATSVVGQPVTVSVRVAGATGANLPSGSVLIAAGVDSCAPVLTAQPDNALTGQCEIVAGGAGDYVVSAVFSADTDAFFDAETEALHSVLKADTTLAISGFDPASPPVGVPVAVSIDLAVTAPGAGSPSGIVSVSSDDDSCQINLTLGEDSCDLIFAETGPYTVSATYPGDAHFNGASDSADINVSGVPVTVDILDIAPSPSVTGQGFTVSFLVEAANAMAPEGSVTVSAGAFSCGPVVLTALDNGQGSCEVTATAAGELSVVATFTGTGVYDSGASSASAHTVTAAATVITASSDTPTVAGNAATVTATLAVIAPGAGMPTGNIQVAADSGESCSIDRSLAETSCELVLSEAGVRTLTLSYNGDGDFLGSNEELMHVVEQATSSTSLVSSTPATSAPGQTATFAFSVTPASTTGSVEIRRVDNDDLVCMGSLAAGTGSCDASFGSGDIGGVTLRAVYPGDDNHTGSTSANYQHAVERIDTTLALSGPAAASAPGETVTFSWTLDIDPARVPAGAPGGTIDVSDGNGHGCLGVDPADGECSFVIADEGDYTFIATYSGDLAYSGSSSGSVGHSVARIATQLALSAPATSTAPGESVTLTWVLSPDRVGQEAPTGTVDVSDGTDVVCEGVAVDAGECSFLLQDLDTYSFTATYAGDDLYVGSSSAPAEHEVARIATTTTLEVVVPDPQDIRVGDTVTFAWDVSAVRDNFGTLDGSVEVVSGSDSCSAGLEAGSCEITLTVFGEAVSFVASYSGNDVFAPSDDVLTLEILETPREVSFDAVISKRVLESLILLDGGDWVLFEIVVRNQGADPIAEANVLDLMPAEFDITTVAWECEAFDGAQCGAASGTGDLDEMVVLPSGGSVRYLLSGFVPQFSDDGVIGNLALVDAGVDDVDLSNNQDSAAYQRCEPNRQSDPGDLDLREHNCLFRNGYEALPLP